MTDALRTHYVDQIASEIRDYADGERLDLQDPTINRLVRMVAGSVLAAGCAAEPDHCRVANAMFLVASAWDEVTK